jgi:hypothetical protein
MSFPPEHPFHESLRKGLKMNSTSLQSSFQTLVKKDTSWLPEAITFAQSKEDLFGFDIVYIALIGKAHLESGSRELRGRIPVVYVSPNTSIVPAVSSSMYQKLTGRRRGHLFSELPPGFKGGYSYVFENHGGKAQASWGEQTETVHVVSYLSRDWTWHNDINFYSQCRHARWLLKTDGLDATRGSLPLSGL